MITTDYILTIKKGTKMNNKIETELTAQERIAMQQLQDSNKSNQFNLPQFKAGDVVLVGGNRQEAFIIERVEKQGDKWYYKLIDSLIPLVEEDKLKQVLAIVVEYRPLNDIDSTTRNKVFFNRKGKIGRLIKDVQDWLNHNHELNQFFGFKDNGLYYHFEMVAESKTYPEPIIFGYKNIVLVTSVFAEAALFLEFHKNDMQPIKLYIREFANQEEADKCKRG